MTPDELRKLADEHEAWDRDFGEASPLWLRAHTANDGNRDAMWDWLEKGYCDLARLCADLGEALERIRTNAVSAYPVALVRDEAVAALAKLSELNNGAEAPPESERTQ